MYKTPFQISLKLIVLLWAMIGIKANSQSAYTENPISSDTAYVLDLYDSAYLNSCSYDVAMDLIAKASGISKNLNYKRGIAISYFYMGSIQLTNDRQKDAINNFETALVLLKKIKLYDDVVLTYRGIGNSYYFLSDFKRALHYSQKGLVLSDSLNNKLESARLKSQIGSCYEDMGEYEKSLTTLLEANRDYNLLNNQEGIAESLNSLGVIYSTLNQFKKADNNFIKALQIYENMNDNYGISNCLTNIGYMFYQNDEPDSALLYFQKSLQIDSIRNDMYGICLCLANIGEVYSSKGDYAKAKEYFTKSLKIAKGINNITMVSGINYQLANLSMELGDYTKAILYGNESLVLARQTGNPQDIINTCKLLAELYTQEGKYKRANECFSEILKLNDSVFSIKKNQEVFIIESKHEAEKQELKIQLLKNENEQHARNKKTMVFGLLLGAILLIALSFIVLYIKRSRNRARIQKKYFETLIANSEDYVIVVDEKAQMKYVSPSYEKRIGRKMEDRIRKSALEFIHPDDKSLLQNNLKKTLEIKKPISFEFRAQNKSGEWMNLLAYAKNLMDDPDINGIVINIWDITIRKQNEKTILTKQKEIEQSQKLAKLGSWKININTGIITLSKEVMALLGEKEKETNLFFDDFISRYFVEEDISYTKEKLSKAIKSIKSGIVYQERFEARVKRKNPGGIIHIELWSEFAEHGVVHGVTQDITEKRQIKKQILEKQKELEKSQKLARIGSWKLNINTGIFTASKELMFLKGGGNKELSLPFEEYAAKYFFEEDLPMFRKKIKLALEKRDDISYKARFEGRVKTTNPTGVHQIVMWGEMIAPGIVHGVTQDITEKKDAEKKIFESEKKYRNIYNAFQDVYYKISIDGTVLEISPSVESVFGYSQEEIMGKDSELFYNMDADLEKIQNELIENQEIKDIDINLKSKEKKTIYCSLSAKLTIDETTQLPTGIEGVLRDISDRRKAEMDLKVSEKKFRDIFNAFPDIYYKTSIEGIVLEISPSVKKIEGTKREQIIGEHFSKYFSSVDNLVDIESMLAKNGIIKDIDLPIKLNDGTLLYCSISAKILFDELNQPIGAEGVIRDISDRKKIELKLKESEKKYRDVFNAFPDVYYKVDNNETIVEISPSVTKVGGYLPEDIVGTHVSSFFFSEDDRQGFLIAIQENFEVKDYNIQIRAKDGKIVDCSLNAKVIFDNNKNKIGIEGVLRDISDRRKIELALKESEKKYREIFDAFPDIFFLADTGGIILEISPSVTSITGYLPEELIGINSKEVYPKNEWEKIGDKLQTNPTLNDCNTQLLTKNNEIIDCSLNIKIFFDENNKPVGLVGVVRDISNRRKIEFALKESEKKYRDVFNAFIDVYYQLSMEGIILEITPSVEHIGYTRKELIGTPASLLYPKDVDQALLYEKLSVMKQVTDYDIIMLTKDKRKINCAVTARVLYDEKGKPLMIEGVIRDISDRVKTHKILKQSENELRKSNATKEKILSIIGHDLLGPIGTNKGITDLIVNENFNLSKDKIIDLISSLKPSIDSTYTMVENLLSWARIQRKVIEFNPEPSYLKLMINECFSLFSFQAKSKSINLRFSGFENQSAYFDGHQIIIILRNLISNAIKFTDKGGEVTVNMGENNGMAEISVTDTGIGIPEKLLSGLFEDSAKKESRFGTDNERGTGLGLVIVKEFVNINKGEITVASKEGTGTTFTFTLPLVMKLQ